MDVFQKTFYDLQKLSEQHECVLVAFSGGKDSLAILDMATRVFRRVVCFHAYFIPGLRLVESQLDYARQRWNVPILEYPDPALIGCLQAELFCDATNAVLSLPPWTDADLTALALAEAKTRLVINGSKKSDGMGIGLSYVKESRRKKSATDIISISPLFNWNKWHVLSYLKSRGITPPPTDGRNSASVDCTPNFILFLHDHYPDDFARFSRVFRYAGAPVKRRDWFGIDAP